MQRKERLFELIRTHLYRVLITIRSMSDGLIYLYTYQCCVAACGYDHHLADHLIFDATSTLVRSPFRWR